MRADARRNYQLILTEAAAAFAERGLDTSLEDIARRASISIGTLYRHFPTRHALLDAVLGDRLRQLATARPQHGDADGTLTDWLGHFVAEATAYRGLAETVLAALADPDSRLHASCLAMHDTAAHLLRDAQQHGTIRSDVHIDDLLLLATALAWSAEHRPGQPADRLSNLLVDGLRRR
ncbi:helix-turn-helix domain-containing protein [Dactylosporangium sp. NPDC005572]|uniref:TetR/AcrR family transcriptional regulator n=1 Tax=Dactylosporangium sp. NPDC005572 TaxID=3156889 RepID=UPI0033B0FFE3